jgi:hypothetical protein
MISPLPRNNRAPNPRAAEAELHEADETDEAEASPEKTHREKPSAPEKAKVPVAEAPQSGGLNNPFAGLEIK